MKNELWSIVHKHFCTDHIEYTSSVVKAPTKQIAMDKFNKLAAKRSEYPYCYSQATLENISKLKILI